MVGDGHAGAGDLGVSAAGRNDIGGIGPQLLSMAVYIGVGWIYKMMILPYHTQH